MKFVLRSLVFLLATLGTPALADITATYVGPNGAITMKIEVAADGDVRGAVSNNPNMYFITHDGHGYVVQATFDGPAVMRIEDMGKVMAEQMRKISPNFSSDLAKNAPAFEFVKRGVVTIRGRQGAAYYTDKQSAPATAEKPDIVISSDPKLAPLGAAMDRQFDMSFAMMGGILGGTNPFKSIVDLLKTGAPLAVNGMELDTVNEAPIPAERFALPAEPLTLEGVRKAMGASPQ